MRSKLGFDALARHQCLMTLVVLDGRCQCLPNTCCQPQTLCRQERALALKLDVLSGPSYERTYVTDANATEVCYADSPVLKSLYQCQVACWCPNRPQTVVSQFL